MKKTFVLHLIFMALLLPVYYLSQQLANLVAQTVSNPFIVLLLLFGIPILYFILWIVLTIKTYKKKSKKESEKK